MIKKFDEFICESFPGSNFREEVKFPKAEFEKWKKETKDNNNIEANYDSREKLWLVYIDGKHIGTYNDRTQILWCDDIKIFGNLIENLDEAMKYKPEDFNLDNAPKELVQYVIDNVDDFGRRYQKALTKVDRMRCPLRMADSDLYNEICDNVEDWCSDNDEKFDDYDIDEIFDL